MPLGIRNIQYYYLTIDVMATKLMLTGIGLFLMASARSSIRLKAKSKSRSSQRRTIKHILKDKTNIIQMKG
ncbi:hypothetical protein T12_6563 [Trichinella patagoniensis]|uniref:Uncharacterized protein n=1 Tax=Trichinella patagoniensis TaxID=990121 RepID=A0A0V1AGQ1_9BILA|nr:hypothetical protein T12_6563 [Trichinella patagoniensis]